MDPAMMKMAQEQMAKMSPEQMAEMMQQVQNMDPAVMRSAMASMGAGLSESEIAMAKERMKDPNAMRQAQEAMARSSPADLLAQRATQQRDRDAYAFSASTALKLEGNALTAAGKYDAAVEKYSHAARNLTGTTGDAARLRHDCMTNAALCHLKRGAPAAAAAECTAVLVTDPNSLKAYYRRGQAHAAMGDPQRAVRDLRRAAAISPGDGTLAGVLAESLAAIAAAGLPELPPEPESMTQSVTESVPESMTQSVTESLPESIPESGTLAAMRAAGLGPGGGPVPAMTPALMKTASAMMAKMTPEDMGRMAALAAKLGPMTPGAGGQPSAEAMAAVQEQMRDPETLKSMSEMLSKMDPSALAETMGAMGVAVSPEQAKQAAAMMQGLKPADLQRLMWVAGIAQSAWARFSPVVSFLRTHRAAVGAAGMALMAWLVYRLIVWWGRRAGVPLVEEPGVGGGGGEGPSVGAGWSAVSEPGGEP